MVQLVRGELIDSINGNNISSTDILLTDYFCYSLPAVDSNPTMSYQGRLSCDCNLWPITT